MPSSIPAAKAQILSLLNAASWPASTPDVRWGGPTNTEDYSQTGEMVYFAETRDIRKEYRHLNANPITETYTIRVYVDVVAYGDFEQDTETRAFQLTDTVESVLHGNHNLVATGAMNVRLEDRSAQQINVPLPEQWLVRVILDQEVEAQVFNP